MLASNLLAAGGIAVDAAGATETVDDLVAAYDGQQVVCLAGSDGAYDAWADEAVGALREAGAAWVVIAGKPRDSVESSASPETQYMIRRSALSVASAPSTMWS